MTLRLTEISGGLPPAGRGNAGRFTPCRTGERRLQWGGLPPAGRGNAGRGNAGRFTPLPDVGTPILECGGLPPAGRGNAGRFTPCRTGERRFGMWRFTPLPDGGTPIWNVAVYPLPDGGTRIWIVAVYAGYGNVTATIANVLPVLL